LCVAETAVFGGLIRFEACAGEAQVVWTDGTFGAEFCLAITTSETVSVFVDKGFFG
jgi:hypothetical protein